MKSVRIVKRGGSVAATGTHGKAIRRKGNKSEKKTSSGILYPNPNKTVVPLPDKGVVSVIMPAYRSAPYIAEAVQSALDQEMPSGWEVEVLIGVDGCPETLEAAKQVRKKQGSRVRLFAVDENGGKSPMLNFLVKKSDGDLLELLDSDDLTSRDRFVLQHDYLKRHPDVDLVGAQRKVFGLKEQDVASVREDPKKAAADGRAVVDFLQSTWCCKPRVWELVGGACAKYRCGMDDELFYRMLAHPDIYIRGISRCVLFYRKHGCQLTSTYPPRGEMRRKVGRFLRKRWKEAISRGYPVQEAMVCALATEVP